MNSSKIGITLGDPAGIGPEIVEKVLRDLPNKIRERVLLFGDRFLFSDSFKDLDVEWSAEFNSTGKVCLAPQDVIPGHPNKATGCAQIAYLEAAVLAAKKNKIRALVTAPISKASAQEAGFAFPGHTEFLENRLGAKSVAMMFAGPNLKVVLATVHHGLLDLGTKLTQKSIMSAISLLAHSLRSDFGIQTPNIGVLGLNPHASEGGRFGTEEERIILPAIQNARKNLAKEITIEGPLVPDVAFRLNYDAFVAMYHDQGLIPVKLIDFEESVNMTLGLPIVRTSPDHGVAYDIAGQGIARSTSMQAALALAIKITDNRETQTMESQVV